jgi:hypothetical protein
MYGKNQVLNASESHIYLPDCTTPLRPYETLGSAITD